MTYTHIGLQKLKFKSQSVQKLEQKHANGQTDGRTDATDCSTFPYLGKNDYQLTCERE